MSYTSYLVKQFNYSHENQFFRKFSEKLKSILEHEDGEHVLIGNVSVNGHSLDAIFITRGQISIIDFKNYSGNLKFSENGPWLLETIEGEQVYVQGGGYMRNPYEQVRAYRFSLMGFLQDCHEEIFYGLRTNINWSHIASIVLFHNPIYYDKSLIPGLIKPWFHIEDNETVYNLLLDKYSDNLNLTDKEIENFLNALSITSDHLLERTSFTEAVSKSTTNLSAEKIAFIRKLIGNDHTNNETSKLLKYYRTLMQLERFKEPTADNLNYIPFDFKSDNKKVSLDISENKVFNEVWQKNKQENFPKNLFIALEVLLNGKSKPLLYTVQLTTDIKNNQAVEINLDSFELNTKELEVMGLDESIVEEIDSRFNQVSTLEKKVNILQTILSDTIKLGNKLIIGLSSESMFTAQLQGELTALLKIKDKIPNGVFDSFLFQKNKLNTLEPLLLDPFIQITSLNSSQKEAINQAFTQDITVITGPPGTGKSQVVANILANAAFNNHSVLFASKNNKAVDNVKERLDSMLDRNAITRFGSKNDIEHVTKPILGKHLHNASINDLEDVEDQLTSIKKTIVKLEERRTELNDLINRIPDLENQIEQVKQVVDTHNQNKFVWLNSLKARSRDFFIEKNLEIYIDRNEVSLTIKKIQKAQSGFFSKIWFDLFYKTSIQDFIKKINNSLPSPIKAFVEASAPWANLKNSIYQSFESNLTFIVNLFDEQIKVNAAYQSFLDRELDLQKQLDFLQTELKSLISQKPSFLQEIERITKELPSIGIEALKLKLDTDLYNLNRENLQEFMDYLPVKIWKELDVQEFTSVSKKFLDDFHVVCVTSLSIKNSFPLENGLFDMVVIDEASQCDLVSALPMIFRAKRAVIIGDPLQLKHITSVQNYEEEYILESLGLQNIGKRYVSTSLYDYASSLANKAKLTSVFLKEHYRCHPEIISFSNYHFYEKKLGQSMDIMTKGKKYSFGKPGLNWIPVKGEMSKEKNLNVAEANACIDVAKILLNKYPEASIGIVTPFRDQKKFIFDSLPSNLRDDIKVDTVHQYQGDEKDIMILSLVVTDQSPESKARFLNRNEYLINVAITRAKSSLYIMGDWQYCYELGAKGNSNLPLQKLASYAKSLDKVYWSKSQV